MDARLNDEELQNPLQVITNFFANYSLPEVRTELKQLEGKILLQLKNQDKNSLPYDDIVFFFEQLDKLIQAAYLLKTPDHNTGRKC